MSVDTFIDDFHKSRFGSWDLTPWDGEVLLPEWFMDRLIPEKSIGMLFGPSNSGKSHLALDLAVASVMGETSWCGIEISPGPVVIFAESIGHIEARVLAYMAKYDQKQRYPIHVMRAPGIEAHEWRNFGFWVMQLEQPPKMMVFDTFSTCFSFTGGESENDNSAVAKLIRNAEEHVLPVMDEKCSIMFIHHTSKASGGATARGASALLANIDYSIRVEWDDENQRTLAFWEKDRWRLRDTAPIFAGHGRRVMVQFKNGEANQGIVDWTLMDAEQIEVEKALAKDLEFEMAEKKMEQALRDMIAVKGKAYVHMAKGTAPRALEDCQVKPLQVVGGKTMANHIIEWIKAGHCGLAASSEFAQNGDLKGMVFV